jgi:hypothetical protein
MIFIVSIFGRGCIASVDHSCLLFAFIIFFTLIFISPISCHGLTEKFPHEFLVYIGLSWFPWFPFGFLGFHVTLWSQYGFLTFYSTSWFPFDVHVFHWFPFGFIGFHLAFMGFVTSFGFHLAVLVSI